jgi:GNAT superfamily N-acetyltransferase
MDLGIRVASETDLDARVRLGAAFRDHLGQSTPSDADFRASIARLLKDAGTGFFPACGAGETGLGYAQCRYRYSARISALAAELEDIFVAREARRQGMGRQLLEFAVARATRRGCRSMGLNTNERNRGALALYQKCGVAAERTLWDGGRQLWLQRSLENA